MDKLTWEELMEKTPIELSNIKEVLLEKAADSQKDKMLKVQNILWLQEKINR